jgi:hypothetical protein
MKIEFIEKPFFAKKLKKRVILAGLGGAAAGCCRSTLLRPLFEF